MELLPRWNMETQTYVPGHGCSCLLQNKPQLLYFREESYFFQRQMASKRHGGVCPEAGTEDHKLGAQPVKEMEKGQSCEKIWIEILTYFNKKS